MPSTSFTQQQLDICQKHLAAFCERIKATKPTILAMAMKEITNMASNMPKKEKGTMAAVSDIFGPKLV